MSSSKKHLAKGSAAQLDKQYDILLDDLVKVLEAARRAASRSINTVMTATYWTIGSRIVEHEQRGAVRAEYGATLLKRLAQDLTRHYGRGFSKRNLEQMRRFYVLWPQPGQGVPVSSSTAKGRRPQIAQTVSAQLAPGVKSDFPLPWSQYVQLMSVESAEARAFYEAEALRGGWSIRQLERQIATSFYERTLLSRNKTAMLKRGALAKPEDELTPKEEIKDPFVLEFLGLKDEYSESELEEALIAKLEVFLLELGGDFAFVGRQRRLRIGDKWFRVDLLFYHRRLRALIIIDLKVGEFTHADAGQMHMYLNYAREHWTFPDENPPVGLILCAKQDAAVAHYSLEGLPNKVLAAQYRLNLPDEKVLAAELQQTARMLNTTSRMKRSPVVSNRRRRETPYQGLARDDGGRPDKKD